MDWLSTEIDESILNLTFNLILDDLITLESLSNNVVKSLKSHVEACSDSVLVIASFAHISDPLCRLVPRLLLNTQVAHSQTRACECGHLEVQRYRRSLPDFALR